MVATRNNAIVEPSERSGTGDQAGSWTTGVVFSSSSFFLPHAPRRGCLDDKKQTRLFYRQLPCFYSFQALFSTTRAKSVHRALDGLRNGIGSTAKRWPRQTDRENHPSGGPKEGPGRTSEALKLFPRVGTAVLLVDPWR